MIWFFPPLGRSGHSERRTLFHETSELVAVKTRAAIDAGLKVILCIGETLHQRELEQTSQVCQAQIKTVVDVTKEVDWRHVASNNDHPWSPKLIFFYIICSATSSLLMNQFGLLVLERSQLPPKHRRHTQTFARTSPRWFLLLSLTKSGSSTAVAFPLKIARNWVSSRDLFSSYSCWTYLIRTAKQQDVDGFLVGGASLKPEFADIVNAKKNWSLKKLDNWKI